MPKLNVTDLRILEALDSTPNASNVEIARETGLSRNTVQARMQRLEETGVLSAPSLRVSPATLGFPIVAFITIELVQGNPRSIAEALREIPELIDAHAVSGDGDLFARIAARDTGDLYRVTQALLKIPGVVRTRSMISIHEIVSPRHGTLLNLERQQTER